MQSSLVEHTKIEKMTLSKSVRQLQDAGFVKRENSKEDGRAVLVHLTSKGQQLVKQAVKMVEDADETFFSSLSQNQKVQFRQISLTLIGSNTG